MGSETEGWFIILNRTKMHPVLYIISLVLMAVVVVHMTVFTLFAEHGPIFFLGRMFEGAAISLPLIRAQLRPLIGFTAFCMETVLIACNFRPNKKTSLLIVIIGVLIIWNQFSYLTVSINSYGFQSLINMIHAWGVGDVLRYLGPTVLETILFLLLELSQFLIMFFMILRTGQNNKGLMVTEIILVMVLLLCEILSRVIIYRRIMQGMAPGSVLNFPMVSLEMICVCASRICFGIGLAYAKPEHPAINYFQAMQAGVYPQTGYSYPQNMQSPYTGVNYPGQYPNGTMQTDMQNGYQSGYQSGYQNGNQNGQVSDDAIKAYQRQNGQ